MAFSTCAKCDGRFFELVEVSPAGSQYKMFFVQCSKCGAPTGVTEYYDVGFLVKQQEAVIKKIETKIDGVASSLSHIEHLLRAMAANQR